MAPEIPQTVQQWNVDGDGSFDVLKYSEQPLEKLGDSHVLVKRTFTTNTTPLPSH